MKNLAFAGFGLIIVLVGVFLFSKAKSSNDTIIPAQIPVESPKQSLINQNQVEGTKSAMTTPFKILSKEEITGKKIHIKTSKGDIVFELFDDTPITASSFLSLANKKFYDGVIFHRVIKGFMIQGGDPTGTGTGGPDYSFKDELDPSTASYKMGYVKGIVAMANAGPNTNGSQFFIMHQNYQLPHNYTIFGQVTSGIDVVDAIAESQVDGNDKPVQPIVMEKVTVE